LQQLIDKYSGHPYFLGMTLSDINQPSAVDDTLLHIVARVGTLEEINLLLNAQAQVNAIGDMGQTPLHDAAIKGRLDIVKRLVDAGGNPRIKNEFDQTPGEAAECRGHIEVAEFLNHVWNAFPK
jgi:ankyrin repeat protein